MAGQTVVDPVRRQRMTFHREGEVLVAEVEVAPGGDVPAHLHPSQEERFEVLEGAGRFRVGRETHRLGVGDRLAVPPGTMHAFRNTGEVPMRIVVEVDPALHLQEFLEEAARLAREGRYGRLGVPHGPRAARELLALLARHRDEIVMAFPPRPVQRLLLRAG